MIYYKVHIVWNVMLWGDNFRTLFPCCPPITSRFIRHEHYNISKLYTFITTLLYSLCTFNIFIRYWSLVPLVILLHLVVSSHTEHILVLPDDDPGMSRNVDIYFYCGTPVTVEKKTYVFSNYFTNFSSYFLSTFMDPSDLKFRSTFISV